MTKKQEINPGGIEIVDNKHMFLTLPLKKGFRKPQKVRLDLNYVLKNMNDSLLSIKGTPNGDEIVKWMKILENKQIREAQEEIQNYIKDKDGIIYLMMREWATWLNFVAMQFMNETPKESDKT